MKTVLFAFSLFVGRLLYSQDVKVCVGTAQMELSKYEARVVTEKKVRDLAIINALETTFGTFVVQGNTTYLKTIQEGAAVTTSSSFNMIANTQVRGELVEMIEESFTEVIGLKKIGNDLVNVTDLRCEVTIRGRELIITPIEFEAYPLACENPKCVRVDFNDGDDLFFYFNSPVSGYLWIYLDDTKDVYCLLPYADMPNTYSGGYPIKSSSDYIFFTPNSKSHGLNELDFITDRYTMTAESPQDFNRIYVVFSKIPLNEIKASLDAGDRLGSEEREAGYTVPRHISTKDFQKWLAKNRSLNTELQIKMMDITISK